VTAAANQNGPQQFGNAEANLRFLEGAGALTPGVDVLEIGTGTGGMLHGLLSRGLRVRGVEINPALIAESRRWFGELPVQPVSGVALPFPDASFDLVLSFDVFEHIRDSDAHLREGLAGYCGRVAAISCRRRANGPTPSLKRSAGRA